MDPGNGFLAAKLTDDLVVEILSRLPFKSFCRFKCVCKAWLALSSDPQYCKKLLKIPTGMAASQPNKPTMKEDGEDEMAGWWEKAAKKLREEDAAKLKKKEEELETERKRIERGRAAMFVREQALVRKCEETQKKRLKDFQEKTMKLWAIAAEKEERENKIFMKRVVKEAHLIRKREEEEEEERKKKKGKGPCSTQ